MKKNSFLINYKFYIDVNARFTIKKFSSRSWKDIYFRVELSKILAEGSKKQDFWTTFDSNEI